MATKPVQIVPRSSGTVDDKVRTLDNTETLMDTWNLVREQIEQGHIASLAWAAGNKDGSVSLGFNLAARYANRHHLAGAVSDMLFTLHASRPDNDERIEPTG